VQPRRDPGDGVVGRSADGQHRDHLAGKFLMCEL
jgi:hypothetical protein